MMAVVGAGAMLAGVTHTLSVCVSESNCVFLIILLQDFLLQVTIKFFKYYKFSLIFTHKKVYFEKP
jgi:hypothetical protein